MITVPAVHDRRQVDIDDVSRPQLIIAGNPVTDDLIDARADGLWKPLVPQAGRPMAMIQGVLVDKLVDVGRADSGSDVLPHEIHQLCVESAGAAQSFLLFGRPVQRNAARMGSQPFEQSAVLAVHGLAR